VFHSYIKKITPSPKLRKRGQILNPLGLVLLVEVVEARKAIVAGGRTSAVLDSYMKKITPSPRF
jgi:uncharacterized protein YeaO (DUF488 family)